MSVSAVKLTSANLWLFAAFLTVGWTLEVSNNSQTQDVHVLPSGWPFLIKPGSIRRRRASARVCLTPPQPANGKYEFDKNSCQNIADCKFSEGTALEPGSQLIYRCNAGYKAKGNLDVFCRFQGKWTTIPECIEVRCDSLNSASTMVSCTRFRQWVNCDTAVLPETRAEVSCRRGYKKDTDFITTRRSVVNCNGNGEWVPEPIRCIPACGLVVTRQQPLIVGGTVAKIGDFPWHASLFLQVNMEKMFICGATIIQSSLVMTAAHCVYDEGTGTTTQPEKLFVVTGNIFRDYDSPAHNPMLVRKAKVKHVYTYCNFYGLIGNYASDIALIILQQPFEFSSILLPACLDDSEYSEQFLEPGVYGRVAGFGRTASGTTSSILQTVTVPYVSYSQCRASKNGAQNQAFISSDKFCAGHINGSTVCEGDSGGGLVFQKGELWYVLGIVSVGLGVDLENGEITCDRYSYTLYTKVANYMTWIQDVLSSLESDQPYSPCRPEISNPDMGGTITRPPATVSHCLVPPQPINGNRKLHRNFCDGDTECNVSEGIQLELGSQLIYSCDSPFVIDGGTDVQCTSGGRWTAIPACVVMGSSTLYGHYVSPRITSGLDPRSNGFYLNGKQIALHSGALHYFRVPQAYWRNRLRKFRAAGLNAVETYVPWNLHEPGRNEYDFGNGNTDFSEFLDIVKFIKIAQEEDLFVIVRPGPYICAELDFGGLPSWLLNEEGLKVRTSEPKFIKRVTNYFNALLPLFTDLQFTKGGSIIAFQVENEYGSVESDGTVPDIEYLRIIEKLFKDHGLVEMFFTSDILSSHRDVGALPGVLQMANLKNRPEEELNILKELQPNKPAMVMEHWTGWFDHWLGPYHTVGSVYEFADVLERILSFPSSVNFYMFHGGTTFGFMNGAKISPGYQSGVTSYDYDAPLSESGDYTEKYFKTKEILAKYQKVVTKLPDLPAETQKVAYPTLKVVGHLDFEDILSQVTADFKVKLPEVTNMENLPIKNGNGQSYGYVNYRKKVSLKAASTLKISGYIQDTAIVLIDGELKSKPLENSENIEDFGYWVKKDSELALSTNQPGEKTLDIIVENWGRVNFGVLSAFDQRKGLWQGPVYLDNSELKDWEIFALEFDSKWVKSLKNWKKGAVVNRKGPSISQLILNVNDPQDTFIDLRGWSKGIVFVNGFNLGRYCHLGPIMTLYLPAPLLKKGGNEILVFDHFKSNSELSFLDHSVARNLYLSGPVPYIHPVAQPLISGSLTLTF